VLAATAVSSAACLLNPWGWRGAAMFWTLFGQLASERSAGRRISELQSPLAHLGWSFVGIRLPLAVALSALALWLNRRRVGFGWLAVWAAFGVIGASAERNLGLFGWIAASTIVIQLGAWRRASPARAGAGWAALATRLAAVALALAAIGSIASDAYYRRVGPDRRFGLGVAPGRFPDRPLAFLAGAGLGGRRLLANLSDSDYVLFARGERSVFVDGRLEVYDAELLDRAFDLFETGRDLAAVARGFDVRLVMVESGKDAGMLRALLRDRRWSPIYFDADRVVFALAGHNDEAVEPRRIDWLTIGDATQTDFPGDRSAAGSTATMSPERLRGLGRLGSLVGNLEMARRFDRRALLAGARGEDLVIELAALERLLGNGPAAAELLRRVPGGERMSGAPEAVLAFASADGLEAALAGLQAMAARGELDPPRLFAQLVPWSLRTGRLDVGARIADMWTSGRPDVPLAWSSAAAIERARGNHGAALR
jgi:hypothetical protein